MEAFQNACRQANLVGKGGFAVGKKKEPEPSSDEERVDAFLDQLRKMKRKQRHKQQPKEDGEKQKKEEE
jgi:hypothetical protein